METKGVKDRDSRLVGWCKGDRGVTKSDVHVCMFKEAEEGRQHGESVWKQQKGEESQNA